MATTSENEQSAMDIPASDERDRPSTLLVHGELDYNWKTVLAGMPEDEYASLMVRLMDCGASITLPPKQPGDGEEWPNSMPWSHASVMDAAELRTWSDAGIKVGVRKVHGLVYIQPEHRGRVPINARTAVANPSIVNIAVPGGGALMQVRTVAWLEDACTNALQAALDEGWRILAVCPPNDTRRPTYIVGHHEVGVEL